MNREDLIRALESEMGFGDTDIDIDEMPGTDETPDIRHYSDEMLVEEGRRWGVLSDDEGVDDDESPLARHRRGVPVQT